MKYLIILILVILSGCDYEIRQQWIKNGVKEWATIMNYQINDNIVCECQTIGGFTSRDYWICNVKVENEIINLKCVDRPEQSGKCIKV
jgi:hypothetical protein